MRADHGDQSMGGGSGFGIDDSAPSNFGAGPDGATADEDGWEDEPAERTYTHDLRDWNGGKWRCV